VNSFFLKMSDGTEIAVNRWIPTGKIKAIVQLSHGMNEYSMRYQNFGEFLAQNGYVCNAHDHRGHGKTAERAQQNGSGISGYLADKNGFQYVTEDLHEVTEQLKSDYPGKKIILIGHSFGSFITQSFIENYGRTIDSCILCGTAGPRPVLAYSGFFLVSIIALVKKKYRSSLLNKAAFGAYNKHIPNAVYSHEWLSRDLELIKKYEKDPWCNFIPTVYFFRDMLQGLCIIHSSKNIKKLPQELPVCLLCGSEDPVGNYGRSVQKLYEIYKSNGVKHVELKLYPGARHELLNETNKQEVKDDILDWIKRTT
jgi:alpha-beta hydrolase superfamily lysophospholipase